MYLQTHCDNLDTLHLQFQAFVDWTWVMMANALICRYRRTDQQTRRADINNNAMISMLLFLLLNIYIFLTNSWFSQLAAVQPSYRWQERIQIGLLKTMHCNLLMNNTWNTEVDRQSTKQTNKQKQIDPCRNGICSTFLVFLLQIMELL